MNLPTRSLLLVLLLLGGELAADPLRVAVASNFRSTLEAIGEIYTAQTGSALVISSASTGVLYSQALFGAPFDALLAADSLRPRRLVESGHALGDSLTTYAYGQLVLAYAPQLAAQGETDVAALLSRTGISLAIANPELAPYGRAAREVLEKVPLASDGRLLTAANVGQAFQMWHSGGADLALVSASYRPNPHLPIPAGWYTPIAQQAVILSSSTEAQRARDFLAFLTGDASRSVIEAHGYRTSPTADTDE